MASLPQRIAADRGRWPTARVDIGYPQLCRPAVMRALRVAAVALPLLVIAAPSRASDSCMTRAEAQQRFSSSYLYWHGADHCWDATPPGRLRKAQRKTNMATRRTTAEPAPVEQRVLSSDPPSPEAQRPAPDRDIAADAPAIGGEARVMELAPAPAGGGDPHPNSATPSSVTPPPQRPPQAIEVAPSPPEQIERKVEPALQRREMLPGLLSAMAMAIIVAVLAILEWKRRSYAKRVLRFVAIRRERELRLRPETGERVGAPDRKIVRTLVRALPESIQPGTAAAIYRMPKRDRAGALLTEAADPATDASP